MDELEKRVKKLELTNVILKLFFVICLFVGLMLFINNYNLSNRLDNYYIYLQDQLDGTYDKVEKSSDISVSGAGVNAYEAEINAYINARKLYFNK